MTKKLNRNIDNALIGGVCSGIADYFNCDPTIIRLITILLLFAGMGLLPYLIAWCIIPAKKNF